MLRRWLHCMSEQHIYIYLEREIEGDCVKGLQSVQTVTGWSKEKAVA